MDRRRLLTLLATTGAGLLSMGHSPYRQWYIYRRIRLFVLTSAADPDSYPLGEAVAAVLATHLPESRAMATRTHDAEEIVKLLGSAQLDLALLRPPEARDANAGAPPFAEAGAVALRALATLDAHLFVCRDDFPDAKAHQIAQTLAGHWHGREPTAVTGAARPDTFAAAPIPYHPGALEYSQGRAANQ